MGGGAGLRRHAGCRAGRPPAASAPVRRGTRASACGGCSGRAPVASRAAGATCPVTSQQGARPTALAALSSPLRAQQACASTAWQQSAGRAAVPRTASRAMADASLRTGSSLRRNPTGFN